MPKPQATWCVCALAMVAMAGATVRADDVLDEPPPSQLDPSLSADTIYDRVLANRFDSSAQELRLASGDRAGRELPVRVVMLWRRYLEGTRESSRGILSRTLIRYHEPSDVRDTGYLVINKKGAPNDQFIYLPSLRRTRRLNLRTESVVGTDLSVEDIIPRELGDAAYRRVPDVVLGDTPCYVVEAIPTAESESGYSKFWIYVEGTHFVPLKTRYWDEAGVEVKVLTADPASIRKIEDIWLPVRATMRHLLHETYTRLTIGWLSPNPDLPTKFFTQRKLEQGSLRLPKAVTRSAVEIE